jgi:hypothetical protein
MIAVLCFFLTLFASPLKSKSRLEAENAAPPTSTDCAAAEGARSRPTHEWGSLVLRPAVWMVSIGAQGHHDHPARDPRALASGRLPSVLALEISLSWRPTKDRRGPACVDLADERGKSVVGNAARPWRAAQARLLRFAQPSVAKVHGQAMWTAVSGMGHLSA